jgi:hypothetical protein
VNGTWKTTGGSGGAGAGVAIVAIVVIAAAAAGPAAHAAVDLVHAVGELLRIVLIGAAVLLVVAVAAGIGLLAWRRRRTPPTWTAEVQSPACAPQRVVEAPAAAQHVLPPQIHLHLHGPVSAADVAELIARQGIPHPAITEDSQ